MSSVIRVASEADATAISEIYAPAVLERSTSFEVVPPDPHEFAGRIANILRRYPWLVCEQDGTVIGYAYACAHRERAAYRWSVDVSAYISGTAHRRGIGTALYSSLFGILATQRFRNAYAGITLPNAASEGMHRSNGFELVGIYHHVGYKQGTWHDVAWFERSISERIIDPPEPIPFPDVRSTREVAVALKKGQGLIRPMRDRQS
ncbi:MAG: N-acetyltransferase family protein [Gemmatimonadaceae bacterium]